MAGDAVNVVVGNDTYRGTVIGRTRDVLWVDVQGYTKMGHPVYSMEFFMDGNYLRRPGGVPPEIYPHLEKYNGQG
jgi:hypothetical protein